MKGASYTLRLPPKNGVNNKLEIAGRVILDSLGYAYQEQAIIGSRFVVDVLLLDHPYVIQWDGDFWHANPAIYTAELYPIQETNRKRDVLCNAFLAKRGLTVLRFWESDVHQRPSWVAEEIRRALANSSST